MQDHPPVIDVIQAIRHNPGSSFEYWIMLGTIFEDPTDSMITRRPEYPK